MKVVLFCGGMGARLRDYSGPSPKPMVTIGSHPILWHVMKYYAHFGHTDFILCLGYGGDYIQRYFQDGAGELATESLLGSKPSDIHAPDPAVKDWRITFVDTGPTASIGERLKSIEPHLEGEDLFLANYSDGLTDLPLPEYVESFRASKKVASFLCVKSTQTFHVVAADGTGVVSGIDPLRDSDVWINGGFFAFRKEVFDYIEPGEDLVAEPFHRLIAGQQLMAYKYTGFWAAMDTFKDRQWLMEVADRGAAPWEVWKTGRLPASAVPAPY